MWNPANPNNPPADPHAEPTTTEPAKPSDAQPSISAMSSALNVPTRRLEQFMAGKVDLETLAACHQVTEHKAGQSTPTTSWSTPYPHSMYEPPNFTDVMAGSSTPIRPVSNPVWQASDAMELNNPFRSPPTPQDANLMELQTVTPSRIQHSPTKIISRKSKLPTSPPPQDSNEPTHRKPPETQNKEPTPDSSKLFKIVISSTSTKDPPTRETKSESSHFLTSIDKLSEDAEAMDVDYDDKVMLDEEDQQHVQDIREALNIKGDEAGEKRKQGASSRLPRELRGLMGEANLCYARGDHDDAIKMCMEIIRLVPYAAEPFETLSMIYDERGEPERSLQYSLLAAHLSPRDADQWLHLAGMCLKQGESMKAINCYAKAFKVRPEDYNIIWESAKLHQKLGLIQKAMGLYKQVVALMPKSLAADSVALARDMAKNCHSNKESSLAVDLLEQALLHHGPAFKDEDANMLCELLILLHRFQDVLEVLCLHSKLEVQLSDGTTLQPQEKIDNRDIVGIAPPSDLPIDLQSKVVVAMVHLRKSHLVHDIFTKICEHDPKDIGDLHFDIAEAYTEVGEHVQALVVLNLLVTSPNYSLAAVWLKHAECERICGNLEKSLKSYRQCVRLAPGHIEAHIKYAETLKLAGRYSEANKTLEDADSYEAKPDTRMQLHLTRYHTLKEWSEKSKSHRLSKLTLAADVAILMFANRLSLAFNDGNVAVTRRKHSARNPLDGEVKVIMKSASYFCKESDKASAVFLDGNPAVFTNSEWLKLFKEVIVMLVRCQRYQDAIRLSDGAQWYSPWYDNSDIRNLLERVVLSVCLISGNYKMAYNVIRQWLISSSDSNHLWNIFNQITARTGEVRHHRFCLRRLIRVPNNMALVVLNGHNWLASGTYKHALGEYERAHKMDPENPLYLLLIGVVFFHISCQKYTDHKHSLVVQGLAFFEKYRTARRLDQESYYNLGRALHQIGLETFALHYYLRALDSQPVVVSCPGSESKSSNPHFDLTCEIGFNLSLIYRKSGNIDLANQTIHKYCVV